MTFQTSYAKLLSDPKFGNLKQRREHAKYMYEMGMRHLLVECYKIEMDRGATGRGAIIPVISTLLEAFMDKEIAEESK